ncbi:stage III sporulation protein AE [Anaerobranca californiensis DSM 14826]|jgi:stage III sporulation protein AE|uniref:Stage III sporulation protein AE n=1 Tax=Anaerobranca californiensis DSM 14826 TaxID=1120989 RepID=A0A1M6L7H7_9FIRM|nr:stage III sporulation protein AE [Anaerobranca californiensis]SHJ67171.1 stage III sporulation protein AE [Anaerobranca californiensis DSM 14826]
MKKYKIILVMIGLILFSNQIALAEGAMEQYIDLTEIENFYFQLEQEFGKYIPTLNLRDFWGEGSSGFSLKEFLGNILAFMFKEVVANTKLMGQLIILAILGVLLENLKSNFYANTVAKLAQGVIFLVLFTIAIKTFYMALQLGNGVIDDMITTVKGVIPLLLTLMAGMGSVSSVALFKPLVILCVNLGAVIVKGVVFPLIFLSTILNLVDCFSSFKLNKLAGFLRDISMYILGFTLITFVGITGIQGVGSAVVDGIGMKTGKFAAKVFIPVVGGLFADAFETVAGASMVLKQAISIYGMILIILYTIFPLIKILAIVFIYRLTAALLQPLGDTNIVKTIETLGNSLIMLFIAVMASSIMYFMTIAIIMGAGNITQMVR